MSAGGGAKLRPRSRSGATVKHSTHSRSKETHSHSHSTHALKSEPKHPASVTPRQHLYFPLKDIRPYVNGRPDDARVNVNVNNTTSRKGWESRVCEKSRSHSHSQGHMRRRSHSTSIYMEPWSKYETLQNYRNTVGSTPPVSIIRWNPSILNPQVQKFSGKNLNLNVSYNGEFRREPNILENPEPLPLVVDHLIETRDILKTPEKSEEMKTELYTELLKYLTDEWDSKMEDALVMKLDPKIKMAATVIPPSASPTTPTPSPTVQFIQPRKPFKSVTFTPDTIFFERNLNSRFWIEITYRQQVRRIQRRKLGKINLTVRAIKSSTDVRKLNNDNAGPSSSLTSPVIEPGIRRKRRHKSSSSSSSVNKNHGFWDGLRKAFASIFTCHSTDHPPRRRIS